MSSQKYFLNTFPLKYQRVLRYLCFRKYYLPAATGDAATATATATASALDLLLDFSFAPN